MSSKLLNQLPLHSLPGPENILRQELANGMVVLARSNPSSGSLVISGNLLAGGLSDPDDRLGLADFTAAGLMRGTQNRSFQEIYDMLESLGASLGFSGGTHLLSFSGKSLVEDLEVLLTLLAEALRYPVFPAEHVERLRAQFLTSLAIRAQSTDEMASLAFDQIVYRNHPYRRPEEGYPETIQAIQREDLIEFHKRYIGPRGVQIAIVGGIDPAEAVEKVNAFFGDWSNPLQTDAPALPPLTPLAEIVSQHVEVSGKSQADLVIGVAGPPRSSPDYMAASLGNHVLGRFGMMGRLGESLREKAGLAYYAGSSLNSGLGPGPWDATAGVDPENLERAVELILAEIRRFVDEPVSHEELADSQANYIGRLPISLESNSGIASAMLALERHQLGLDYYLKFPDLVNAVTPQEVQEVARRYLDPDRLAIASAGPGERG